MIQGQVRGHITSKSGRPVLGATVITPLLFQATTDGTGDYVLEAHARTGWKPKLVIFYAPGFRPRVQLLSERTSVADAVLDAALESEWRIKACSASQKRDHRIGSGMRLAVPTGAEATTLNDDDYTVESIIFRSDGKSYVLEAWTGSSCCSGRPNDDKDVIAAAGNMRTWAFIDPNLAPAQHFGGLDMRGKKEDGTYWRWLGPLRGSQVQYKGATEAVSRVFDTIIDSMCFEVR